MAAIFGTGSSVELLWNISLFSPYIIDIMFGYEVSPTTGWSAVAQLYLLLVLLAWFSCCPVSQYWKLVLGRVRSRY